MPTIISDRHDAFLKVYRETGEPMFIAQVQNLYIKNSKGYIAPIKLYLQFYYDKTYGHVFCAVLNKNKSVYPFKNKKLYGPKDLMIIMTDDTGTICEINSTVTTQLGMPVKVVQQNQMFMQDNIKISHMLNLDL